jgi:hypothetical protein
MSHTGRMPGERAFGLSVGGVSVAIAAWLTWKGAQPAGAVAALVGTLLVGCGLLAPAALRIPNRVWWRIATVLGWVNTRLLLTVFFFLVMTPTGVVMRLFGRSPLRSARSDTNWSGYDERRRDSNHYTHLY